jgi:hypothetical protein
MVQAILASHPRLQGLGLVYVSTMRCTTRQSHRLIYRGWHFDAMGISGFCILRRFTLRAKDDDGDADMDEIRAILDHNKKTLVHLTLSAYLIRDHSWDDAFKLATIQKLTHLDLVDTRIYPVITSALTR